MIAHLLLILKSMLITDPLIILFQQHRHKAAVFRCRRRSVRSRFCLVPVQVSFHETSMGCVISLPIRLTGHDHLMAALLCGLSGKLHFLMRAVSSITLTCSRAVT